MIPSRRLAALLSALLVGSMCELAAAASIGWRTTSLPATAAQPSAPVALWYPAEVSSASTRATPMGPFSVNAAIGASPAATVRGLILLSHGTGGSELAHGRLAEALASSGYLVAALRHPGDNWQDDSLRTRNSERYFDERPRQLQRVIDTLLADPTWAARIARDDRGPRVGAVGHSAGGYTVLALAGGKPAPERIAAHCGEHGRDDPVFCSLPIGLSSPTARMEPKSSDSLADPRVRAVAALSPLGVVFEPASLRSVRVPVALWAAEHDRFLVPRFHAKHIAKHLPSTSMRLVAGAWHFAFLDTPSFAIPSADGDLRADPVGFDRARLLEVLGKELAAFFDEALR